MYRKIIVLVLVAHALVLAGCGSKVKATSEVPSSGAEVSEKPVEAVKLPEVDKVEPQPVGEESPPEEEGACQGKRWRIVPLAVYEYPQGDGWKFLIIPLAVENGSELWGNFVGPINKGYNLTTEEGYSYGLYGSSWLGLQDVPDSPYSGFGFVRGQIRIVGVLPPGFRSRGGTVDIGPTYWGAPNSWSQLVFQVAENQEQFKLTIQSARVHCILPDGSRESEILGPFELDLSTATAAVAFPSDKLANQISQDFSLPFEIGGASLQITNVYRGDTWFGDETGDLVIIEFQVTNLSGGYEVSGSIGSNDSYLIGDDGLIRRSGCGLSGCGSDFPSLSGRFQVGPGQVGEASLGFIAPKEVGNLKFVVSHNQEGVYLVFDLPDDF